MVDDLQEGQGSAGKLLKDPALYDETQKTIAGIHKLVDDLNAGKGTAGKLLKSDELSKQLSDTIAKLDLMLDKVNSGQGTIGQLLVNQQLYDNLNGATREMHLLMKDFRANPKKFLRIKLVLTCFEISDSERRRLRLHSRCQRRHCRGPSLRDSDGHHAHG